MFWFTQRIMVHNHGQGEVAGSLPLMIMMIIIIIV